MSALAQYKDLWGRLKTGQRVTIVGAALATVAVIAALVYYGSQPEYGVLFSDLKPADAQGIVEKLKAANVDYKLSNNGTTLSVPNERVAELRLQMASSGALTGGHVGFDLFDRSSFGATDFAQQVNYRRAIEGELARTLEGMEEVEQARVHVTQARESIFSDKEERAKASVMLKVRQGREMSRERTESIVNLVASAVERLDPGDISVMDTRGRLLSSPARASLAGASAFSTQLEARGRLEAETATRIVSLLEPVIGAGHVRADVTAELDFSRVEQTEEKYNPQSAVIRSQQTTQESRNGGALRAGGISGARANDPAAQPTPTPATNITQPAATGDQRAASTTTYEIDKTVKHTTDGGGGRVTRMSVSVVVDYKTVEGNKVARTPEELRKMQDLVAAAVGVDEKRGDLIVVQTIPFNEPSLEAVNPTWLEKNRDLIKTAIRYGALAFAVLLLIIFVIRPARRALRFEADPQPKLLAAASAAHASAQPEGARASDAGELPPATTQMIEGQNGELQAIAAPRTVAELEAEMEEELLREANAGLNPVVKRSAAIKKQLVEQGKKEPEAMALTIRGWLQEMRG